MKTPIKNIICISDTHFGCQLGLCPPKVKLDSGGYYYHTHLQSLTWAMWNEFWNKWVPRVTKGEDYIVVHNGDVIDGVHHQGTTQISHNLTDQQRIAEEVMSQIIARPKCKKYFHIRGTEAHVGPSGALEEKIAENLKAIPDEIGNHARWDLWLRMHDDGLIHFSHHIGTTSSAAYESTAVYKEMVEAFNEAGRWKEEPPSVVIRSHRHRALEVRVPIESGYGISAVTPGWQLKTPFVWRGALGRTGTPQIGGYLIRAGSTDGVYTRFKVWKVQRSKEVSL